MWRLIRFVFLVLFIITGACKSDPPAPTGELTITSPLAGAKVKNPVEVCFGIEGLILEASSAGVKPDTGHHHILIDVPVPSLTRPIPKNDTHIHMGDGSKCHTLTLTPGKHRIRGLFARGNHVPFAPAVTAQVDIEVIP